VPSSDAYGHMDLVTVVAHELGHVLGFEHGDAGAYAVMHDELEPGMRYLNAPLRPDSRSVPVFDTGFGVASGTTGSVDWRTAGEDWSVGYSPYEPKPKAAAPANVPEFLFKLAQGGGAAQYDSLGSALLGKGSRLGR